MDAAVYRRGRTVPGPVKVTGSVGKKGVGQVGFEVGASTSDGTSGCTTIKIDPGKCVHYKYMIVCYWTVEVTGWWIFSTSRDVLVCHPTGAKSAVERPATTADC